MYYVLFTKIMYYVLYTKILQGGDTASGTVLQIRCCGTCG